MSTTQTGQVVKSAAEVYDEFFVPALFGSWAAPVAEAAGIKPGHHVLDVACGTGVLTREITTRVAPDGSVIGLDINDGMLRVARAKAPALSFQAGRAEALPFGDARFDVVTCQFGLMFFEKRTKAIQEMMRVLKPGGRLAVAVWDAIERIEGYAPLADLLARLYGPEIGAAVRAPFVLGDRDLLTNLFAAAGVDNSKLHHQTGVMRFPSLHAWLTTEIRGWVLADRLDDAQFAAFLQEAQSVLAPYVLADGMVALQAPAYIVSVQKAESFSASRGQ